MKAKTLKARSTEEINLKLQQCLADGFMPTLAIVFMSIYQDREAVVQLLSEKRIEVVGATSSGEFINDYEDRGTTVILLMDINPAYYSILYEDLGQRDLAEATGQMAKNALQKFEKPAFILCSTSLDSVGDMLDGEKLIRSIEKVVGPQVTIYGGMAGDDESFTGTYVFTHDRSTDRGMVSLVLDEEKIQLTGMAISGWKPIGITRTVTRSDGRWIYTIDNQPALDMYLKYLGNEPFSGEEKYKMYEEMGVHYPFQVERGEGEPAMVSPMTINPEENAIQCEAPIPQGSRFRFSLPPDFDIVDKVIGSARELKNTREASADAMLIFSCVGRLGAMGPLAYEENQGLGRLWEAPMAGFYSYGEYGRTINGRQDYHSTTCCWVAIKEK